MKVLPKFFQYQFSSSTLEKKFPKLPSSVQAEILEK
jgi:hypothetical protein